MRSSHHSEWLKSAGNWNNGPVRSLRNDAEDVRFLHDQQVFAVDLHFRARPLAEQDAVTRLDIERAELVRVIQRAGADGDIERARVILSPPKPDDGIRLDPYLKDVSSAPEPAL